MDQPWRSRCSVADPTIWPSYYQWGMNNLGDHDVDAAEVAHGELDGVLHGLVLGEVHDDADAADAYEVDVLYFFKH